MADKRLIRQHLIAINLQSRSKQKTPQELEILVDKFHGEMVEVTDTHCNMAFLQFMRQNPYFPAVKEILDRIVILKRQAEINKKYLPKVLSKEQIEINMNGIKQVRERLRQLKEARYVSK